MTVDVTLKLIEKMGRNKYVDCYDCMKLMNRIEFFLIKAEDSIRNNNIKAARFFLNKLINAIDVSKGIDCTPEDIVNMAVDFARDATEKIIDLANKGESTSWYFHKMQELITKLKVATAITACKLG